MNSSLDVVTGHLGNNNLLRREIPKYVAVGRRCQNDDVTVDCINHDDVIKRRSVQHKSKRKHKSRQPEMNTQIIKHELSDDEDTGSVCSSASGSSGGTSHQRSTRKPRCYIHGPRRRQETDISISDVVSDKLTVCCTCRPMNKKTSGGGGNDVIRPEPEGGPQTSLFRSTADEFERLIYGPSEPLFSDCELAADDMESVEVRTNNNTDKQRVKNQGPTGNDSMEFIENIFSSIQMVNTNTFMKIAIIQNELKNIKSVSLRRAESDVTSLCRRAEVVKDGYTQSEHSLQSATQLLLETVAEFKTQLQTCDSDGRSSQSNRRQSVLHLEPTRGHVTTSGVRRRLINTNVDIENAANSLDAAEVKVTELEEELKSLVGSMSGSTSDKKEKAIRDVTLRLKEAEHCAMFAEQGLLTSKRGTAMQTESLMMNLAKYQHVGSSVCSFSLADLIDF